MGRTAAALRVEAPNPPGRPLQPHSSDVGLPHGNNTGIPRSVFRKQKELAAPRKIASNCNRATTTTATQKAERIDVALRRVMCCRLYPDR